MSDFKKNENCHTQLYFVIPSQESVSWDIIYIIERDQEFSRSKHQRLISTHYC